ncbi:hypothetical protein [Lichenibacterium ramalinae]|jgi:hypothetical protein|nr:hypothetical protein [Lichenibacterium ramalinae]
MTAHHHAIGPHELRAFTLVASLSFVFVTSAAALMLRPRSRRRR